MKSVFFLFFYLIVFCFSSRSQGAESVPLSTDGQVAQSMLLYDQFTGAQSDIYNGGEYLPFIFKREGIPFFKADTMATGWIGYENRIYEPMTLQYDVVRNQVVILDISKRYKIVLHNELVDSFQFRDHRFIKLKANSQQNLATTDFYDVLYKGDVSLFASRKKIFKDVIKDNELVRVFSNQDRFYVFKKDKFYLVSNKKDVFRLFNDKKSEIKTNMRRSKIKFRKNNFEEALVTAVSIYDQH